MSDHAVNRKIRDSIVAGIFYPDDPQILRRSIESSMRGRDRGDALAIVSPHAGFEYAGATQGAAWAAAAGRSVDTVVIIAPFEREGRSCICLPDSAVFKTPLGDIPVDMDACAELESCSTLFETNDLPHLEEYAIETQLPFMRHLFPQAGLVPMLVSGHDAAVAIGLSRALDLVFGASAESTLFVVSMNLAASLVTGDAERRSDDLLEALASEDWRGLVEGRDKDRSSSYGASTLAAVLATKMLSGARYRLVMRSDSRYREDPGASRVVFYAALAWHGGS